MIEHRFLVTLMTVSSATMIYMSAHSAYELYKLRTAPGLSISESQRLHIMGRAEVALMMSVLMWLIAGTVLANEVLGK